MNALKYYCNCIINECVKRWYNNTTKKFENVSKNDLPLWYTNKQVQYSHMSSLHRKNPEHYLQIQKNMPNIMKLSLNNPYRKK